LGAWGSINETLFHHQGGNEYIVQWGAGSILRVASRRLAARLIAEASELLALPDVRISSPECDTQASMVRDRLEAS
jgi:hypothetical protein